MENGQTMCGKCEVFVENGPKCGFATISSCFRCFGRFLPFLAFSDEDVSAHVLATVRRNAEETMAIGRDGQAF